MNIDKYRVKPGDKVDLQKWDPDDRSEFEGETDAPDKDEAKALLPELNRELEALQELFYADGRHRLLVVLQATDT